MSNFSQESVLPFHDGNRSWNRFVCPHPHLSSPEETQGTSTDSWYLGAVRYLRYVTGTYHPYRACDVPVPTMDIALVWIRICINFAAWIDPDLAWTI